MRVCLNEIFYHSSDKLRQHPIYGFNLDDNLYANINDYLIPAVNARWDSISVISGLEGSGKSTIACTVAHFCDPTFNIDRIVFTPAQLMEAIDSSQPKQAIVFDEAVMGMLSQDAATAVQSVLIKKFVTIRKKRLFIFIVIPSLFLLRKYFAIFRTRFLLHTFTPDGITRGFFKFYSYNTKRRLYIRGLKEFDQGCVREDFSGKFSDTEGYFYNADDYDYKKEEAIRQLSPQDEGKKKVLPPDVQRRLRERDLFMAMAYNFYKFHAGWKQRLNPNHKPANELRFVNFVKQKYGYATTGTQVKIAIRNAINLLDAAQEQTKIETKKKKLIEIE